MPRLSIIYTHITNHRSDTDKHGAVDCGSNQDPRRCRHRKDGTRPRLRECVPGPYGKHRILRVTIAVLMIQLAQSSMYRICTYPEYVDKLRAEACGSQGLSFDNNNREMPYMDSFIKESARLGPGPIRKYSVGGVIVLLNFRC